MRYPLALAVGLLLLSPGAFAHEPAADGQIWALLPPLLILLVALCWWRGAWATPPPLYRMIGVQLALAGGLLTLIGPLDQWAHTGTGPHMVQHMLMIGLIAPAWVLLRPQAQLVRGAGRLGQSLIGGVGYLARHPLWMAYLHGGVIWLWHLPVVYDLALDHAAWHAAEHLSFLLTAVLFWWAVLSTSARRTPFALLALLLTLMHTGFLGAIMTFAREPFYADARDLQDQQLAGLIMWVLGGIPYLLAAGWVTRRWLLHLSRRMANA
ncbi:MAG: cytochrome c oxidase assembly protein [Natronospirillum sp.]|uniref:cytochrome c oxidase assembly protein n=1 Tax=Natronospirillum sp. TaxID=2812955 RepID=UPI0025EE2999|nr:cytochrome c oxidase assembly protein [Natronospirillum sp.]MCH8551568.1 cytochrome c oxidase assembly protein [Natronospirillum sp.]